MVIKIEKGVFPKTVLLQKREFLLIMEKSAIRICLPVYNYTLAYTSYVKCLFDTNGRFKICVGSTVY